MNLIFIIEKEGKQKNQKKKYNKVIEKIIRNKSISLNQLKKEVKAIIDKNKEYYNSNL